MCVCVCVCVCVSMCRILFMANDNCRKFKQNQIIFWICARVVEDSRPIDFGEDRLRGRGSSRFMERLMF